VWSADAVIVIDFHGGSLGAGMELAWVAGSGAPVLILVPEGQEPSRQLMGATSEIDLCIEVFAGAQQLGDLSRQWLTTKRSTIEAQALRRALRQQRSVRLLAEMAARWSAASDVRRTEISAIAGRPRARIARLASDIDALLMCSLAELEDVTAALGVEMGSQLSAPTGSLDLSQLRGLQQASREYEWSADTVVELVVRAQGELITGAVRRLPLSSVDDWLRFKKARLG
jgi:hypothetical protein